MASDKGIRAGRAFVELFADDSKLVRGLKAAEKKLKAFGAGVQSLGTKVFSLGAGLVSPLVASAKVFSDMGGDLADMSQRTGVSVEALSELGYAAEQSGADMTTLEGGLRKMQKSIVEAASGSESARESLGRLGLSVEQLAGLSPDQQFALIADRLNGIRDPAVKSALAMELFGKTGTALLPLMSGGAQGIADLREQARKLGLTMSTEDAQAAEAFGDTLDTLWKVLRQGAFQVGAAVAPILSDLAQTITRVAVTVSSWIKRNRDLIATVFKVAAVVAGIGAALFVLGGLISGLGTAFGIAATVLTGIGTVLGTLGTVIGALLSPIGLVTAAVVGLGAYLIYASGAGSKALAWLTERFADLKTDALAAWQGISDALAAGDIGLAARILWLTLKVEWQKGVNFLQEHWIQFKEFFLSLATDAFYGVVGLLVDAWAGLQVAWVETTAFLADAWTVFLTSITKGWNTAQNFISKGVLRLMALFDDSIDVEGASQILDEELSKGNARLSADADRSIAERDRHRQRKRSEIETERQGAQTEVQKQAEADHQARRAQFDADRKASDDALTQARKEWQDSLADAAKKRSASEAREQVIKARDQLDGMDELLSLAKEQTVSVQGTFSAAAVRGLGAEGVAERTAKATEETAKNTKRLLQEAQHGGLTFA